MKVTVVDKDGSTRQSIHEYLVACDPNEGFVTGGGWITSPVGACLADPALTGKASFGFVSKYQKGATTSMGSTEFQFHLASLDFQCRSCERLVIVGSRA